MSVTDVSQRDSRCDFGVSHTTPTRPDPTRPVLNYPRGDFSPHRLVGNARDGDVMVKALTRP